MSASGSRLFKDDGSEVRQLVTEANRAWHISAKYDCANNNREECGRNGQSMNTVSIGIEHAARWAPAGTYVVADALRLSPVSCP